MENLDKYLDLFYLQEDLVHLNEEDLAKVASKFADEKKTMMLAKNIQKTLNTDDPVKSLKRVKQMMPPVPIKNVSSIDRYFSSKYSEYKKLKNTTTNILKNSLSQGMSDKMIDLASSFLVIHSMVIKKGDKNLTHTQNLKNSIKDFVMKTRKFADDFDDEEQSTKKQPIIQKEDIPDLAVAWTIVVMASALAIGLGTGLFHIMMAIASIFVLWKVMLLVALIVFVATATVIALGGR